MGVLDIEAPGPAGRARAGRDGLGAISERLRLTNAKPLQNNDLSIAPWRSVPSLCRGSCAELHSIYRLPRAFL